MADHSESSILEKISEKIHAHDSSDDSDSNHHEHEKKQNPPPAVAAAADEEEEKPKVWRILGRQRPLHHVLGGGKPADVLLWRNKKISAGVLGFATVIWLLFELVEYHFLTLLCHFLILALSVLFLWSSVHKFIRKSATRIPEIQLPEEPFVEVAMTLRMEINRAFAILRDIASGKELKKLFIVIAGLWVVSIVGSWCNFLTLFYISFVLLHTVPVLYDKYEDRVDPLAEKASIEMKRHYGVFDEKVLSKIPVAALKTKKL